MRAKTAGTSSSSARAGDVLAALEAAAGTIRLEGGAGGGGGVVEAGFQGDVAVVEAVGVERDDGPAGRAAEEVDDAAAAHHGDGPLPGGGGGDGFDDDVRAATIGVKRATAAITSSESRRCWTTCARRKRGQRPLILALDDGDDVDACDCATCMNIRPMGPAPMTAMVSPGARRTLPCRGPRRRAAR
jgi:hypothetical protein